MAAPEITLQDYESGFGPHWWFGYRNLDAHLAAQQQKTEARAAHRR
jgi:hypothetical protein